MRMLIDGAAYHWGQEGIAAVWRSILPMLADEHGIDILLLDRSGGMPIPGVRRLPFPTYRYHYTADDSVLIQQICDHYRVDVFTSTIFTTPLTTPMFLLVDQAALRETGGEREHRRSQERSLAIHYAQIHLALSRHCERRLLQRFPGLPQTSTVLPGYDKQRFRPVGDAEVARFRTSFGLGDAPYVIWEDVDGDDITRSGCDVLAGALRAANLDGVDMLEISDRKNPVVRSGGVPRIFNVERDALLGDDLSAAYAGAIAMVHASSGRGELFAVEAMACGCPVISSSEGYDGESASEAGSGVTDGSVEGLARELSALTSGAESAQRRRAGIEQAKGFDWRATASAVREAAQRTAALASSDHYRRFAKRWRALRLMQSEVDAERWVAPLPETVDDAPMNR